jgi:hypothetical protein
VRAATTTYRFCASGGVEIISTGRLQVQHRLRKHFGKLSAVAKMGRSELLFTIMMSRRGGPEKLHSPELVIFRTA